MNNDFARIITLLRKEKKLSQKQAAEELGVSQALLSHYEKGIRECGLDFVVRAAEYYHVSCDYLLGRTAERSFDDSENTDTSPRSLNTGSINQRLIGSSLHILYDQLSKVGSRRLTRNVTTYLTLGIYKIFRCLYTANRENPGDLFTIPSSVSTGYTHAAQHKVFADIEAMQIKGSDSYTPSLSKIKLSTESIAQDYPGDAAALFNVIQQAESNLKSIKR